MQLVDPDILADACGLSPPLLFSGLILGLALWLFGWRCHRFWIVLITTVLAGIYGLYEAPAFKSQPFVAAGLLALAAGVLALALVRLLAFFAGGMAGLLAAQAVMPNFDQPLIGFLVSGLVSLFLFRLSIIVLTSLSGAILISYSGLCLLNHYGIVDAIAWLGRAEALPNWICVLIALMGVTLQFLFRRRRRIDKEESDEDKSQDGWDYLLGRRAKTGWGKSFRRAG